MKAIILASGVGKRLQPLTNNMPKPLIKINNKTIIERQLDACINCNIKNIIITTGLFEEKLKLYLKEKYKNVNFTFVNNPQYDTTNYIYSLWLTKDYIDDELILIHGDLIFDEKLLKKLVEQKENFVLINKKAKVPEKDFKAVIENEKVIKIGVNYFSENAYLSMPIYKFSEKDFKRWMEEIDDEVKRGNLKIYAEDAFNKISNEITLKPLYYTEELCMEIDTIEDLGKAKKMLK